MLNIQTDIIHNTNNFEAMSHTQIKGLSNNAFIHRIMFRYFYKELDLMLSQKETPPLKNVLRTTESTLNDIRWALRNDHKFEKALNEFSLEHSEREQTLARDKAREMINKFRR
jgi:hypothetical protein